MTQFTIRSPLLIVPTSTFTGIITISTAGSPVTGNDITSPFGFLLKEHTVKFATYYLPLFREGKQMKLLSRNVSTIYEIECFDSKGNLKWTDTFHNLVVTEGLNDSLNKHFKASSYTAAWYVGLTNSSPTFAAGDTMASHSGWTENTNYSESNRPTLTLGTVSSGSVDNSANKAVFSINASATIGGAFIVSNNTKNGTTGTLYGGGAFSGGNRNVVNGDTLNVTVTLIASAS